MKWLTSFAITCFIVVGVFAAAFYAVPHVHTIGTNILEDASLLITPDAERAYAYGIEHFSAQQGDSYNIDRAEHFFTQALRLDPNHPQARHELARVFFLRGDFAEALTQIQQQIEEHGGEPPNSFYVRGLILSFMERYDEAAESFQKYLDTNPNNWAALNDQAWAYLKLGRAEDAAYVAAQGLASHADNPWLLNSLALALFDMGDTKTAYGAIRTADRYATNLTEEDWLRAYPGNDPRVARQGIVAFQEAVAANMHSIALVVDPEPSVQ